MANNQVTSQAALPFSVLWRQGLRRLVHWPDLAHPESHPSLTHPQKLVHHVHHMGLGGEPL